LEVLRKEARRHGCSVQVPSQDQKQQSRLQLVRETRLDVGTVVERDPPGVLLLLLDAERRELSMSPVALERLCAFVVQEPNVQHVPRDAG
jgi:hypothetical protein